MTGRERLTGDEIEALLTATSAGLARPPERVTPGQLAAFPVDVPADPVSLASEPDSASQLCLFDPAVS